MKQLCTAIFVLMTSAAPISAETAQKDLDESFSLMEEGAKLFLRGLMTEMEPAMEDLRDMAKGMGPAMELFAQEMGPALGAMLDQVDDLRNYQAPEVLPNGDIIIRRKPEAPIYDLGDDSEIEL